MLHDNIFSVWFQRKQGKIIVIHAFLLLGSLIFLFPLAWMVSTSLKPLEETMTIPPRWLPSELRWENYREAVQAIPFFLYARNTVYVAVMGALGMVFSSSLVAYGFSRIDWPGRDMFFYLTLGTMMVPFPVVMVPLYAIFRELHWIGSFKPLWVPAWFGAAFNIFLLRQFFLTVPKELSDSARIDGCNEFGIYARIVLPLARPALAVVALFHFLYAWNDFLGPLLFLTRQETFTLSLGLQFFQSQHGGTMWNHLMAASTLVILPVILLFFFTQKTFIQGITFTGLKG